MGLDASVYCDCYERNRLRVPPPRPELVFVSPDGSLDSNVPGLDDQLEFDQWLLNRACEHESGVLVHHYLGNISLIGLFREELSRYPDTFPILLQKVVYNGVHGGDFLTLDDVSLLRGEVDKLVSLHPNRCEYADFFSEFRRQMDELVRASLSIGKPIVF